MRGRVRELAQAARILMDTSKGSPRMRIMPGCHPRRADHGGVHRQCSSMARMATGGEDSCRKATAAVTAADFVPDAKR